MARFAYCANEATAYATIASPNGRYVQTAVCASHLQEVGVAADVVRTNLLHFTVPRLRSLIAFMETKRRLPTAEELARLGMAAGLSSMSDDDANFEKQLAYIKKVADFIEARGWLAESGELGP